MVDSTSQSPPTNSQSVSNQSAGTQTQTPSEPQVSEIPSSETNRLDTTTPADSKTQQPEVPLPVKSKPEQTNVSENMQTTPEPTLNQASSSESSTSASISGQTEEVLPNPAGIDQSGRFYRSKSKS